MGKLIPLVLALVGLGAGVGAGVALRPEKAPLEPAATTAFQGGDGQGAVAHPCGEPGAQVAPAPKPEPDRASAFYKFEDQFVFPLVEDGAVAALVVLSLSLEIAPEQSDEVELREPRLRDAFLRIMLDHANFGGFNGVFTANEPINRLRRALMERGEQILGDVLYDVLILDINRQDV